MDPQQPREPQDTPPPGWQPPGDEAPTGWRQPTDYSYAEPPLQRPGNVTAAAVILIVLGVLASLMALFVILAGSLFGTIADAPEIVDQFGELPAAFGGVLVVFGVLLLAFGALEVVAGIFVLPGRAWARVTGLILALLGALFGLSGVIPGGGTSSGATLVSVLLLVSYVYVAWSLITHGRWFAR